MEKAEPIGWRWRAAVFGLAALSIASLLLYFFGVCRFRDLTMLLLAVETAGLIALAMAVPRVRPLLFGGLLAGAFATLVYDAVRVPLVHGGVPIFKAISYFGTLLLAVARPTAASESVGWAYHLSNGVSFGLMYAALVPRPRAWSAVLWGLSLEATMLATPYAEVFGYARDARFMTITLGSHACYGLALWLALRRPGAFLVHRTRTAASLMAIPLILGVMALDFHRLYAAGLPAPPPPRLGRHLYTTWNTPEPDRLALLWVMKRYVDRAAEVHFIDPFEKLRFGVPLDVPEAEVRRRGVQSATEVLVSRSGITATPRLSLLVRTTHLAEVSRWMLIADAEATAEAEFLRHTAERHCGRTLRVDCLPAAFLDLDRRYGETRQ